MPAPRILPPTQELRRLVEAGLTHSQIVDHIRATSGLIVSRSAVSSALSRAGLTVETPRYKAEIPWRVRGEHLTQYPARMLRLLGRKRAGQPLTDEEQGRVDGWLTALADNGWVVAYVPDGQGFIYVIADEVDDGRGGVPIRRRIIELDELTT